MATESTETTETPPDPWTMFPSHFHCFSNPESGWGGGKHNSRKGGGGPCLPWIPWLFPFYSARRAARGSIRIARNAGTSEAPTAAVAMIAATAT